MSYALATIKTDVPLDLTPQELHNAEPTASSCPSGIPAWSSGPGRRSCWRTVSGTGGSHGGGLRHRHQPAGAG